MANTHSMTHSGGPYGENIFQSQDPNLNDSDAAIQATQYWYKESSKYDYNNPGFSATTGHFTQVVWKSTQKLGIGIGRSSGGTYVCGSYDPRGNVDGEYPQNVLRP